MADAYLGRQEPFSTPPVTSKHIVSLPYSRVQALTDYTKGLYEGTMQYLEALSAIFLLDARS